MKRYLFLIFLVLTQIKVNAQHGELKKLKLSAVDTAVMSGYYLLTFKDDIRRYQLLSFKQLQPKTGCWEFVVIGKEYNFHIVGDVGYYAENGLYISTHLRGLKVVNDIVNPTKRQEILKVNEFFYTSEDINGLLIKQR